MFSPWMLKPAGIRNANVSFLSNISLHQVAKDLSFVGEQMIVMEYANMGENTGKQPGLAEF